jgi:hypothetical protein
VVFLFIALGVWGLTVSDDASATRYQREREERRRQEQVGDTLWQCRKNRLALDVIKRELREGEFDLSGCPKYFHRGSNWQPLSFQAVGENLQRIKFAHADPQPDNMQWILVGVDHNWHYKRLVCAHTGMPIISYAEIEEIPS